MELMITVVVLAILLAVGIPSFRDLIMNNKIRSGTSELVGVLQFARTEAIRRGSSILVSALDNSSATNEWGKGLVVWADVDDDGTYDVGEELRTVDAFDGSMTVDGVNGSTFSFLPTGLTNLAVTQQFSFCDNRSGEKGRTVDLWQSGLIRVAEKNDCG